jgi:glycosyltransferase involved in cell wall biosynthesis
MSNASFSVVMSVYHADDSDQFIDAVHSVFDQSIQPSELIIAVDGPVGNELASALRDIELLPNVQILRLERNLGPGGSRDHAIRTCNNNIVAIMDADDLCAFNRFERQLQELALTGVDVVGGYIEEFNLIPGDICRIRVVPIRHNEIIQLGHWRQPMNHVTIMFRKSVYEKVGGYHPLRCVEDFDLFHRMFVSGVRFSNIPEVMVHVRCGTAVLTRRRGMYYLRAELALLSRMRRSGFLSMPQWMASSSIRIAVRVMPSSVIGLLYKHLLRQQSVAELAP